MPRKKSRCQCPQRGDCDISHRHASAIGQADEDRRIAGPAWLCEGWGGARFGGSSACCGVSAVGSEGGIARPCGWRLSWPTSRAAGKGCSAIADLDEAVPGREPANRFFPDLLKKVLAAHSDWSILAAKNTSQLFSVVRADISGSLGSIRRFRQHAHDLRLLISSTRCHVENPAGGKIAQEAQQLGGDIQIAA